MSQAPITRIEMQWTNEQKAGITAPEGGLLLSAAAGSGKTSVLAERCVYLLCDAPQPCRIDQLLVLTYTEAAAAEMRQRIEQALLRRLATAHSDHLARQIALLEQANISTLHGFCMRLLRRHFQLVGLDPGFSVLDAEQANLLQRQVLQSLLQELEESGRAEEVEQLLERYSSEKGDRGELIERLLTAHDLMLSLPDAGAWRRNALEQLSEFADKPLEESELGKLWQQRVMEQLVDVRQQAGQCLTALKTQAQLQTYVAYVGNLLAWAAELTQTMEQKGLHETLRAAGEWKAPRMPRVAEDTPGKKHFSDWITQIKDDLRSGWLDNSLSTDPEARKREGEQTLPHARLFMELLEEFERRYEQSKRRLRRVDFSDQEQLALRVLSDDNGEPSAAARQCHEEFSHVLVDEYQDVNPIQERLLRLISRQCLAETPPADRAVSNLFCVGDVKQSIYRFRLADPTIFLARRQRYGQASGEGKVIDLQHNFRSRGELLEGINWLFERLMTRQSAELDYDHTQRLRSGAQYPAVQGSLSPLPIELHMLESSGATSAEEEEEEDGHAGDEGEAKDAAEGEEADLELAQREALWIARSITEQISRKTLVSAKGPQGVLATRELRYGDIAILLRAMKHTANQFASILRAAGIAVVCDGKSGLFQATEISDMRHLLRLLDNPLRDISLAAVLRSPLANLPEPERVMAEARLASDEAQRAMAQSAPASAKSKVSFHQAVRFYAEQRDDELAARLRDFFDDLENWRQLALNRPLDELIWTIYDQSGYLAFVSGQIDGAQRQANLLDLHARAGRFAAQSRQGLSAFLQYLDVLEEQEDLGTPAPAAQPLDAVHITSVHSAKGLEYPLVYLAQVGRKFNCQDRQGKVLLSRTGGLALRVVQPQWGIHYATAPYRLVKDIVQRESIAEEIRILYVALTRARERLVLVGSADAKSLEKLVQRGERLDANQRLATAMVLKAQNFAEWLVPLLAAAAAQAALGGQEVAGDSGPAAAAARAQAAPFALHRHDQREIGQWAAPDFLRPKLSEWQKRRALLEPLNPPPAQHAGAGDLIDDLTYPYLYLPYTLLAAEQSATQRGKPEGLPIALPLAPGAADTGGQLTQPRFMLQEQKPTAAERGTATHLFLQHVDFARRCDQADLQAQVADLLHKRILCDFDAQALDFATIEWLLASPLADQLRQASGPVQREVNFYFAAPSGVGATDQPLDRVMVRGRIDLLIPTSQGLVLVDYKTDRFHPAHLAQKAEQYRGQMEVYRQAARSWNAGEVRALYLAFLSMRQLVQL